MKFAHVVVTSSFAGTERYVAEMARRQSANAHEVFIVGGDPRRMQDSAPGVAWLPGATLRQAMGALRGLGRLDLVHAHLTAAEVAAMASQPWHRGKVVATRHIAKRRGASLPGKLVSPVLNHFLTTQIAISAHVAECMERTPDEILAHGVPRRSTVPPARAKTVLVLQRLEREKNGATALHAWRLSGLADLGWELRIAGDGGERATLEALAASLDLRRVSFLGMVRDPTLELERCSILLAPSSEEALGLSVLEAMACARPVVASDAGGHISTLGADYRYRFRTYDADRAAEHLAHLASDAHERAAVGSRLQARQREHFDIDEHLRRLDEIYIKALRRGPVR